MKRILTLSMVVMMVALLLPAISIAEEEPIKIVMVCPYYGEASTEEGYKMVQDKILADTGVLVDSYRFDSNANRVTQTDLLLTRGKEINIWMSSYTNYRNMELIQPINDYMQYIPHVLEAWEPYDGFDFVTDVGGNVWGIPRYVSMTYHMTFVRQDWLDLLGMEPPKTFDDLEKYLYAVKAADPYGNGGTIPIITRGGDLTRLAYHFLAGFTDYGYSHWPDTDGRIKEYYMQEGFYDFLAKMAQWYKDGIIHSENPSWNMEQVRQYLASGRVAASGAYGTDLCNQYVTMRQNVPGSSWYFPHGLIGPNGKECETKISGDGQAFLFSVDSTEEQMLAAMKLFDWLYSDYSNVLTVQWGIEGVHWEYDEAYENARDLHVIKKLNPGNAIYNGDFWLSIGLATESDVVAFDPDGQQNMHNYFLTIQKDLDYATVPFDEGVVFDSNAISENVPSYGDIKTYVAEGIMAFWIGTSELTEESWQGFIDGLYDLGMDEYIDELTRQYNEAKGL